MQRVIALVLVAVLSLVALGLALRVRFDPSIMVYFVEDDPALLAYDRFLEVFESDQVVVIAYEDPQLWTEPGLAFVHELTGRLEAVEHVQFVRSLTSAVEVVAEPGTLTSRPYYDPQEPPEPTTLKGLVLANDLLTGSVVSEDGRHAAFAIVHDALIDDPTAKMELARTLREVADAAAAERPGQPRMHVAGPSIVDEAFLSLTARDTLTTFPLMGVMLIASILFLFRTWRALLLPLAVVGIACLWVAGVMGGMNYRVTILHNIVFPMVMGVGIASSIHVTTLTGLLRRQGASAKEASEGALRQLFSPCFWTTATTIAGMTSLLWTTLRPLRQVGILATVGVGSALLLTYALGPWLLPLVPAPDDSAKGLAAWWRRWDAGMQRVAELAEHRPWWVLGVSALIFAVALAGLPRLQVGGNPIDYFSEDDITRVDVYAIDGVLAGTSTVEVLVEYPDKDKLKEPEELAKLLAMQEYVESLEGVGATFSIADFVLELRKAVKGGAEAERKLPGSRAEVAQLLVMVDDPEQLSRLVDLEFRRARLTATFRTSGGFKLSERVQAIEAHIGEIWPAEVAAVTGQSRLAANLDVYLLRSTVRSIGAALLLVVVFMMMALRSIRLGLFSMIPNLMPIGLVLGLMGWSGIPLDPGTAMVGAVSLGLVVDDTVHFLHHFRARVAHGDDFEAAVRHTLDSAGRAIVMTSFILTGAFWLMLLASFSPNVYFGLLCGVTVLLALIADLVVLPAALTALRPSFTVKH